jgi:hypothetical protein
MPLLSYNRFSEVPAKAPGLGTPSESAGSSTQDGDVSQPGPVASLERRAGPGQASCDSDKARLSPGPSDSDVTHWQAPSLGRTLKPTQRGGQDHAAASRQ